MHYELANIVTELKKEMTNILSAFAIGNKSLNEQIRAVKAQILGVGNTSASLLLFLQKTDHGLVGYNNANTSPDPGTELLKIATVTEADGLVLLAKWASVAPFSFLSIPAGLWIANIYAFCDVSAGNYLQINVYSRSMAGVETLLFTMTNDAPITWTDKGRLIPNFTSDEGDFIVDTTDLLVFKMYGYTDSATPVNIKVAIAGKSKRSNITYPVPQLHNLLAGKQGGAIGEYYHLSISQLETLASVDSKEPSENKSVSVNEIDSNIKFPVWAAIKAWGLSTFLTSLVNAPTALLTSFPYNNKYLPFFKDYWDDTSVPTWDGTKYAGVVGNANLYPSTPWPIGLRPTSVKIRLNITVLPTTVLKIFVTGAINGVPDRIVCTVGASEGDPILGLGTNVLVVPLDVVSDITHISLVAVPQDVTSMEYDITNIEFYTPSFDLPVLPTDSIGIGIQKLANGISALAALMVFKTVNTLPITGTGNLYAPNYQELYFLTDEFTLDTNTLAYIDDSLGCVLPAGVDSYFSIRVIAPHYWDTVTLQESIYWEHSALSSAEVNVAFGVQSHCINSGDASDFMYGGVTSLNGVGGLPTKLYITGLSPSTTTTGTPARDGTIMLQVSRYGATDNFTGDIYVKGVKVMFGLGDVI